MPISNILPPGRCSQLPGTAELQIHQEPVTLTWHQAREAMVGGMKYASQVISHRELRALTLAGTCLSGHPGAWPRASPAVCHSHLRASSPNAITRSSEGSTSERHSAPASPGSPLLPKTDWWLVWINSYSIGSTSDTKSCFRSYETLPTQIASKVTVPQSPLWAPFFLLTSALFKSSSKWSSQKWNAAEGLQKLWERISTQKKWLSFQSHQPSVWCNWPKPTRALPKAMGQGSLSWGPATFIPFLETKDGISSPGYKLGI